MGIKSLAGGAKAAQIPARPSVRRGIGAAATGNLEGSFMRMSFLVLAALLAASSVHAREAKKKNVETPPPAPVVEYENDDPHMSDALAEACIASPPEAETYDSRDNVLITKLEGGGRAFFHFKAGCDTNTMMFSETIKAEDGSQCVKPGAALVFTSSFGDTKKCVIERINKWLVEEADSDETSY